MKNENSSNIKYSTWNLVKDLYLYIKPFRWRFIFGSLLRLSGDIVNLYPAVALASIVTFFGSYTAGQPLRFFWITLIFLALATLWRIIAVYLGKYLVFQVSERLALEAQLRAVKRLFLLDMAWHEKENAGSRLKKIQKGSTGIDRILRMWVNNYIEIGVNFFGVIIILSRNNLTVGLTMLLFLLSYFAISFLSLRKARVVMHEANEKEEEMHGLVFQSLSNIRSVKVVGIKDNLFQIISRQAADTYALVKRRVKIFQFRGSVLSAWASLFKLGSFAFIAVAIFRGQSSIGFLILFNVYFSRILESVSELSSATQDLIENKLGIERMQEIINAPLSIEADAGKVDFPEKWEKIRVKNLSFAYGKNKVLNNVSFEIKKGERIGVVGLSGAGKSTLFKLLLKENENFSGDIKIDKLSIKKIKKDSYLEKIGTVMQETEVFNFSLRDNITIACNRSLGEAELKQALDVAHVTDYIGKLPRGLDTFIGEKGVKLSGGEKQRLGLARCVYKQPELLFLDEATSHLDLESEEKIKDSLHHFFKKVTAIVIAHRLTTIQEMDRILVIEKGRLIEEGCFSDLLAKRGRFFELWEKQKL